MRFYAFVACILFPLWASAEEKKIQPVFSIHSTLGSMNIDTEYNFDKSHKKEETYGANFTAGIFFHNQLLLDIGYSFQGNYTLFGAADGYDLSQKEISIGYVFGDKDYRFVPRIGHAFWELSNTEGALFNSGPEEIKKIDGDDTFVAIGLQVPFSERFDFSVGFKYMEPKFGSAKQFSFGVAFRP